jgi:DNA-binding XRE family transcriptional regulator
VEQRYLDQYWDNIQQCYNIQREAYEVKVYKGDILSLNHKKRITEVHHNRNPNLKKINKELLYKLYIEENKSQKEMAEILGVSRNTISLHCKKFNIIKNKETIRAQSIEKIRRYLRNKNTTDLGKMGSV